MALSLGNSRAHADIGAEPAPAVVQPLRAPDVFRSSPGAQPAFPKRPKAEVVRDPNNESLCSIIGGDQVGRPIRYSGIRALDLRLFAESDPENARLAALYQRTARPTRVNEHETRLIGYGDCQEMQAMVDAMNLTYYNIPELKCAGDDGLLYRVRRLGRQFKLDIMTLGDQGRSMVTQTRENLDIANTSTNQFGCLYRLTLAQETHQQDPNAKVRNFKICLTGLADRPAAKIQMFYMDRKIPHGLQCMADRGFAEHAGPLIRQRLPRDTNLAPAGPGPQRAAQLVQAPAYQ